MDREQSNFINVEKISIQTERLHVLLKFAPFKFHIHYCLKCVSKMRKSAFSACLLHIFGTKKRILREQRYATLHNTPSYLYTKYQAFLSRFDTQNTCLKEPHFGEVQYGENSQKRFLSVCKPIRGSAIVGLLIC